MPYRINDIYRSIQGEGFHAGRDVIFVRFTGCNMRCDIEGGPKSPGGFACDTEFESGRSLSADEIWQSLGVVDPEEEVDMIVLTGGEPGLQVDPPFVGQFGNRYELAIETNGSVEITEGLDWYTVSPKVAEHAIKQRVANEVKYVRGYGQAVPKTVVEADHYWISPAFNGTFLDDKTLEWCKKLCEENPPWKLSLQQHKLQGLR